MSDLPLVLDLFSGTGSATQPFVECGKHRVVRIDNNAKLHPDIVADVRSLPLRLKERPQFIWASPPCDDLTDVPWHESIRKPERGMALFRRAQAIIAELRPESYVIENVRGAQRFVGTSTCHRGSRHLWTDVPLISDGFLCYGKWRLPPSQDRKALRSMIPRPLADAVHRAVCE